MNEKEEFDRLPDGHEMKKGWKPVDEGYKPKPTKTTDGYGAVNQGDKSRPGHSSEPSPPKKR
ncbi:MAG: hypothetical protein ABSC55_18330 [Syntrophorhabdales bacterium]|jgi:hypothetical protein